MGSERGLKTSSLLVEGFDSAEAEVSVVFRRASVSL